MAKPHKAPWSTTRDIGTPSKGYGQGSRSVMKLHNESHKRSRLAGCRRRMQGLRLGPKPVVSSASCSRNYSPSVVFQTERIRWLLGILRITLGSGLVAAAPSFDARMFDPRQNNWEVNRGPIAVSLNDTTTRAPGESRYLYSCRLTVFL